MLTMKLLQTKEPINNIFAVAFGFFFFVLPDDGTHVMEHDGEAAHLNFVLIKNVHWLVGQWCTAFLPTYH